MRAGWPLYRNSCTGRFARPIFIFSKGSQKNREAAGGGSLSRAGVISGIVSALDAHLSIFHLPPHPPARFPGPPPSQRLSICGQTCLIVSVNPHLTLALSPPIGWERRGNSSRIGIVPRRSFEQRQVRGSDCGARGARPSRLNSHPRPIPDCAAAFPCALFEFFRGQKNSPSASSVPSAVPPFSAAFRGNFSAWSTSWFLVGSARRADLDAAARRPYLGIV